MRRRQLLQFAALTPVLSWLPGRVYGAPVTAAARPKSLILVELKGGNDGLNTVVPYTDPEYYRLRPKLAIKRDQVLILNDRLGLHPALQPLMSAWQDSQLAWVLGVGYAEPNRSHFRSMDIWETASDSDQVLHQGWVARTLPAMIHGKNGNMPDVVILGGDDGSVQGGQQQVISLRRLEKFARQAARLKMTEESAGIPDSLAHILAVRQFVSQAGAEFQQYLDRHANEPLDFPNTPLGQQLHQIARMLLAGIHIPVFKVRIGSFDTHNNQLSRHQRLLTQLAESLAVFREILRKADLWDRVLVISYSEFGRRAVENASRGTDHGTAAPHFVLGGRVKGGVYGEQPTLIRLENDDLRHTVDYRRLYTTVVQRWWDSKAEWQQRFPALDFL